MNKLQLSQRSIASLIGWSLRQASTEWILPFTILKSTVKERIHTNFFGAFTYATAAGRQMLERKCRGSVILVASMSGLIANKGMHSSAYNYLKAAVVQLARNLA